MKRCPTCNKSFTDPSLSFCVDDGTPLVKDLAPPSDSEATVVGPSAQGPGAVKPTQGNAPGDWQAPAYQPPGQHTAPPAAQKRRAWPWVVGIIVVLLVGVVGIGIAAAIMIPGIMRAANHNEDVNYNSGRNLNSNTQVNENSNSSSNTNSFTLNENSNENLNANANSSPASEPPTDEDEVLSDLTDLEKEWTEANFSADKKALTRILADDYVGTQDGRIQGKADYLKDIKADKTITDWELKDLKLSLKGDRATLKGKMRVQREGADEELVLQFTDKFVWRDNRWQAVASEVAPAK